VLGGDAEPAAVRGNLVQLGAHRLRPVRLDYAPGIHNGDYAITQEPEISAFLETGWRPQL